MIKHPTELSKHGYLIMAKTDNVFWWSIMITLWVTARWLDIPPLSSTSRWFTGVAIFHRYVWLPEAHVDEIRADKHGKKTSLPNWWHHQFWSSDHLGCHHLWTALNDATPQNCGLCFFREVMVSRFINDGIYTAKPFLGGSPVRVILHSKHEMFAMFPKVAFEFAWFLTITAITIGVSCLLCRMLKRPADSNNMQAPCQSIILERTLRSQAFLGRAVGLVSCVATEVVTWRLGSTKPKGRQEHVALNNDTPTTGGLIVVFTRWESAKW